MSRSGDYRDDVSNTEFVDQDVERLVSGLPPRDPGLTELAPFMEALRSQRSVVPSTESEEHLAARAAALVRSSQNGHKGVVPLSTYTRPGRRPSLLPARAAFAFAGFMLLIALVGFGLLANLAIPGDTLYSIDLALENVGIGNGTVDERLTEADALVTAGEVNAALLLLGETYEKAISSGDTAGADKTERHLVSASATGTNNSLVAAAKVEKIRQFLADNAGPGVGLDGDAFDRALEELVNSDS